jgi:hypothetical protein
MSIGKLKKRVQKNSRLDRQVEVEVDRGSKTDSADPEVLDYVNEFLASYSQIPPLPPTSLLTQEDAREALIVLNEAQGRIDSHLKTAKALKQLLRSSTEE